jgi:hypothetical protein
MSSLDHLLADLRSDLDTLAGLAADAPTWEREVYVDRLRRTIAAAVVAYDALMSGTMEIDADDPSPPSRPLAGRMHLRVVR